MDIECRQATRLLSEQLDRKLTVSERRILNGHLADCPGCHHCGQRFELLRRAILAWRAS